MNNLAQPTTLPVIGFVTGLTAEARLLNKSGFLVEAGGGLPDGAYRAAERLIGQGAQALVSFGLAGGLAPGMAPGRLLVPSFVVEGEERYPCDPALITFLGGSNGAKIFAGAEIAATVAQKAALYRTTRIGAVDLESGAVARVARLHDVPFAVLRAIADPATRTLPPAALVPLKPWGAIDLPRILRSVMANPAQIPALIGLARDAGKARAALVAQVRTLTRGGRKASFCEQKEAKKLC
jgi:adenosylhomocysteine nucleosidase